MKSDFSVAVNLLSLEETLKAHEPYAALIVSTTGLDNSQFLNHSPIRVVLKQYEYNEETKSYQTGLTFDKMVKAPDEAIKAALENKDYDVFQNGGIDKEKYLRGEDVLSAEDFKKEFSFMMSALKEKNTTVLVNGGMRHAEHYLEKIGASAELAEMNKQDKIIDQTRLTQEYFQKHNISEQATLENLRNTLIASPKLSFYGDKELMADFRNMSKDDFLKTHNDISERAYNITAKDAERRDSKIIGGTARADVINNFVTKYGREENVLEGEWITYQRESEAARHEDLSDKGKENYKNADFGEKIDTLVAKGVLDPDKIMNGDSEFQKLMNAVSDNSKKGIVVMHASSTGFRTGGYAKGFPTQFAAMAYTADENGKLNPKPSGISITIKAPNACVADAEKNINNPRRPYDAFKEAGINLEDYKNGKGVFSQDEAIEKIEKFMRDKKDDYTFITIGGDFTPECMSALSSNLSVCKVEHLDVSQAIKEYAFLAHYNDDYPKNVLFDENNWSGKNFGLEDIAAANGIDDIKQPHKKCIYAANVISNLQEQQNELFKTEEVTKEEPKIDLSYKDVSDEAEEIGFIDEENGYSDTVKINEGIEEDEIISEIGASEVRNAEKAAENEIWSSIENEEYGNLYSDKKGDTVPIVNITGNVQKIGEANIPHISEAQEKQEKKPEEKERSIGGGRYDPTRRGRDWGGREEPPKRFIRNDEQASERNGFERSFGSRRAETQPTLQPAPQADNRQLEMLIKQNEMSLEQNKIMIEQVKALSDMNKALLEQNKVLSEQNRSSMEAVNALITQASELTQIIPQILEQRESGKSIDKSVDAVERIKEEISKISEGLSPKGQIHANNANQALSGMQKEIEREQLVENKGRIA